MLKVAFTLLDFFKAILYELREHQQISVEPGELVNVFIEVLRKSLITFRENWAKLKYKNRNDCI
jgi:hypothetical protein